MPTGIGGEVAWWCPSLDNAGNGTTMLNDLSGNGRNGTLLSMDAATDWVADTTAGGVRALDFDGVNDHVQTATIVYGASSISLSSWVYLQSPGADSRIIFESSDNFNARRAFAIAQRPSGEISCSMCDPWFGYTSVLFPFSNAGQWSHLCFVLDRVISPSLDSIRFFVNAAEITGTLVLNVAQTRNFDNYPFFMGARGSGAQFAAAMRLDDARLFARKLTHAEIAKLASKRGYEPIPGSFAAVHFFQGY